MNTDQSSLKTSIGNYKIANDAIELLIENSLRAELNDLRQAEQSEINN